MKKWLLHIMLVGVLGMLAASCSQEADDPTQDIPSKGANTEKITLHFTLDLGEQGGAISRTTWKDYDGIDNTGNTYENNINPNQLQVYILDVNGTYIGGLAEMNASQRTGTPYIYDIEGRVDVPKDKIQSEVLSCKIMVVANSNIASQATGYDLNAIFTESDLTAIPMWGIGTFNISLVQQTEVKLQEPIYMLRSMAKIEVTLGENIKNDFKLKGAKLSKYNKEGYVVPAFPDQDLKNVNKTTALSTSEVLRYKVSLAQNGNDYITKDFIESVKNRTYAIYVPEFANTDKDLEIELILTDANDKPIQKEKNQNYKIVHGNYKNEELVKEDAVAVIRNWYYRYTIVDIERDAPLNLTLTASPWNLVERELHYKTLGAAKQTITWGEGVQPNDKKQIVLDATHSTANFSFELSTPTGATWYATLVPMGGDENAFSFSKTEVVTTISGAVGQASGTISIRAVNTTGVVEDNNVARLEIIVVTNDGRSINVTDMLGGQYTIMQAKTEE